MRNLLNFKHLQYFWAVAHQGNLTRAAEALNVSQSALSIQIQKLEQQLGHDLFERRGKSLHLTEAGRIALEHADTIFAAGDELLGTLAYRESDSRQSLKVGAEATLSRNFQLGFLKPAIGRDDVQVSLTSGSNDLLLLGLESHRLDVVLTNQPNVKDHSSSLFVQELDRQEISLIVESGYQIEHSDWRAVIAAQPMILPASRTAIRGQLDTLMLRHRLRPKIAAEVDDMAMLRLLVREGVGVAAIPPIVVRDELKSGKLRDLGHLPDIAEVFYAVMQDRRFPNPILQELLGQNTDSITPQPR